VPGPSRYDLALVSSVRIRPVRLDDAEATRAIYNVEILDSTVTMDMRPRSLDEQRLWVSNHQGAHGAIVAVEGTGASEVVLGFASISPYRNRPAYATTVENSVYVDRGQQNRGIGRILLDGILAMAADSGFHACMARVLTGHEASIRLHASRGFDVVGVEREVARKFGRWIDFTLMQKLL
jgi:L-amino acid N-acyltransferase